MPLSSRCHSGFRVAVFSAVMGTACAVQAQQPMPLKPVLTQGYEKVARAAVQNEEIVRQPDLWQMEVQLKSMRVAWLPSRDPSAAAGTREPILYLPFRVCRRPLIPRPSGDITPINEFDPAPGPKQFIPQATLITYDNPQSEVPVQIIADTIIPEAMPEILRVERAAVKNAVGIVQNVPAPIAETAENQEWQQGVFMFRGVSPDTDFFKVIVTGCSNGYEWRTGQDGQKQAWRKVIVQRFQRPGDRYDPAQREFQFVGNPQWILQPDGGPAAAPPPAFMPVSANR